MKKFFSNCKYYFPFSLYTAKSRLLGEVSGLYLGAIWWFLEPIISMALFTFMFMVIFQRNRPCMMAYISCGMMMWNLFNSTVRGSIGTIRFNRRILDNVFIPKYVLLFPGILVSTFKMVINFALVVVFLFYYHVPPSLSMLWFIPSMVVLYVFSFGVSLWTMHFGVYLPDLNKIIGVVLRIGFFMSGVFYPLERRLGEKWAEILMTYNPMGCIMYQARQVLIYQQPMLEPTIFVWFLISIALCVGGIKLIEHGERDYLKVV